MNELRNMELDETFLKEHANKSEKECYFLRNVNLSRGMYDNVTTKRENHVMIDLPTDATQE